MNVAYLLLYVGLPAAVILFYLVERRSQRSAARAFTNKLRAEEIKATEQLLNELREKKFSKKKEFDAALDQYNKQYRPERKPSDPSDGDGSDA